jgi:hypothetical protein
MIFVQLANPHKDVPDSPTVYEETGPVSTSTQRRLKRPRPPARIAAPGVLRTPTSAVKKLRLSPEKKSAHPASPSKPGGDYFASVLTDSEEEGEVHSFGCLGGL